MKQHITRHWGRFRELPVITQYTWMILVLLFLVWITIKVTSSSSVQVSDARDKNTPGALSLATQTVGSETASFATAASWPGEIISPNDAEVQAPREGSIVSWEVTIGQYVEQGQVLGRLSATPLTPDLAKTLADQTEALTRARANASSTKQFVAQTARQNDTFSNTDAAQQSLTQAETLVNSSAEYLRSVLRQAIAKEFPEFSASGVDALILYKQNRLYATTLKSNFGVLSSSLRELYVTDLDSVLKGLSGDTVPEQSGNTYFSTALRLVSASIADQAYADIQLSVLKKTIIEDQNTFSGAVEKYRTAQLSMSEKQKAYAERTRDVSNSLTALQRDQVLAENEVLATEASYRAVTNAITGGANIIAPKSGYVSSIAKQAGDFVTPSESVASISTGLKTDKIVRFRIPSNVEVPKKGDMVRISRPGFAKDIKTGEIVGVGTALDGNGTFVADAKFTISIDWPAHLSVRVIPENRTNQSIVVSFDAVFWDEDNSPHVWVVGDGGIVSARAVRTGRTFGDAVEISEGLSTGETYISLASNDIKEGMRIAEVIITEKPATTDGDGGGHPHLE